MINDFEDKIKKLASLRRPKILIGLWEGRMTKSIERSIVKAQKELADLTVVGVKIKGVSSIECGPNMSDIHDNMINIIKDKKVEGIVRGNVEEHGLLRKLKLVLRPKMNENDLRIQAPVLIKDLNNNIYLLGPGSTVWGRNDREKKIWVDCCIDFLQNFGYKNPKIGFLTSIRKDNYKKTTVENEDTLWSYKTWESAEKLVKHYRKRGFEANNYEIHIEKAVSDKCDIICVAEGPMGNLAARSLVFLGGAKLLANPRMALGIPYEDDSQSEQDYFPHILFATAWVNGIKKGLLK